MLKLVYLSLFWYIRLWYCIWILY